MVAPNRHMFCLACGEIIAQDQIASHMTAYPNHAMIRYHNNLPVAGGDPIGMILSGTLRGGRHVCVDGNRTDTGTPESGTPAQPFRTIQAAVDYVESEIGGPATLHIEPAQYLESVEMPDYIQVEARAGAVLRAPTGGNDALTVTGTIGDPEPSFGATLIRGLRLVSDGVGSWALRVIGDGDPSTPREPFVISNVAALDAYSQGDYISVEGGGLYLPGTVGMGGDDSGGVGIRLKPGTDLYSMCFAGATNLGFGSNAIEIYENSFFVGNGVRFFVNASHPAPKNVIKMDASGGFSAVSIYNPSTMFGSPDKFVEAQGSGSGGPPSALVTVHGGYNDLFDGFGGDLVDISDGVLFRLFDGALTSSGGRGVVVDDAIFSCRNAQFKSGDGYALEVHGDNSQVDAVDSVFDGYAGGPGSPSPGPCAFVDVLTPSVRFNGGVLKGAGTVLDVDRGGVWLLGGVDIDPSSPLDVAYNFAVGTTFNHGHCNVRRGVRLVVPSTNENVLASGFGTLELGDVKSVAKLASLAALPGGGQGFNNGSLCIFPHDPDGYFVYQNIGTDASPDWHPIRSQFFSGSGNPNGGGQAGYPGDYYRDSVTDILYVCEGRGLPSVWRVV